MTAIRPRPTPEQERRAQEQSERRARAQSAAKDQALVSQPRFPLVLAVLYIALLVVPWALMCKIATEPAFILKDAFRWPYYYVQHGWVIAIDVLNSLATVLSLPILSALLARAAVVFSQRRRPGQALTVRQLFALADRGWYNFLNAVSTVRSSALLRLGSLLLFIAILLPLIRSGLVSYDNVPISLHWPDSYYWTETIGTTPSPVALKAGYSYQSSVTSAARTSLRLTTGGIETNLWPVCNDPEPGSTCGFSYGPYDLEQSRLSNFWGLLYSSGDSTTNSSAWMHASTLRAGSSIGTHKENELGAYALGLKTGTRCEAVPVQQVEEQCIRSADNGSLPEAARGWNTSLEIPQELRLNICYAPMERDPWESADASPWAPIKFTEHLYVGLDDPDSYDWSCGQNYEDCGYLGSSSGLHIHCQAESLMSFFEIGKASTQGTPGRLLEEMPAGFDITRREDTYSRPASGDSFLGPLKTATMAMFGNDSWLDVLKLAMADVEVSNLTSAAAVTMLCSMRPLGNVDDFNANSACGYSEYPRTSSYYTPAYWFSNFLRGMLTQFQTGERARATLNTATFYANNALMSALNDDFYHRDYKHGSRESDKTTMYVPVLNLAAIVTVSILIGLQVVGIVILLVYLYSSMVWTWTLDAIAVARIGAQLSALDVFLVPRETGTLGPAWLTERAAKQLDQIDGLVGSTSVTGQMTGHHDIEMATMPPPYAPRGEEPSTREERRLPQPGTAVAARDPAASDHLAPAYTPSAEEHVMRVPSGEAEVVGGRGGSSEMAISHAPSSESQGAVLALVPSIEAIAVGGRGLIPRRGWRKADKPLPPPPAE